MIFKRKEIKELIRWKKDNINKNLRLDYALNSKSIVFDVGGYEGQWTSDIYSMYKCKIYIFEPVRAFFKIIKDRFKHNDDILVYEYGLSNRNTEEKIAIKRDGSSLYKKSENMETIYLKRVTDFIKENNILKIDLIKINIEGGEYELIEDLIESNLISSIINLQIQFHDSVKNACDRRTKIQEILKKTHSLTYNYDFVWENWQIIE